MTKSEIDVNEQSNFYSEIDKPEESKNHAQDTIRSNCADPVVNQTGVWQNLSLGPYADPNLIQLQTIE